MSAHMQGRRWKYRLAGAGCLLAGLGLLLRGIHGLDGVPDGRSNEALPLLAATAGGVLLLAGLIAMATLAGRRGDSASLLRLDHFLPFLRKNRRPAWAPSWITRAARSFLPASWFFDPATGRQGLARRLLQKAGRSVVSSPGRRLIQASCFVLFLTLFFYVCWPYTAVPEKTGAIHPGWPIASIDQDTMQAALARETAAGDDFAAGQTWYLTTGNNDPAEPAAGHHGRFRIVSVDHSEIHLVPADESAKTRFTGLLILPGPWSLHET